MSTVNQVLNTGQQAINNYDVSKIFIFENKFQDAPYNNSAYADVTLQTGTVMGRVTGTGYIKPCVSSATDGSQVPIGVLNETRTFAAGFLGNVGICVAGSVVAEKLIFITPTDNLDTSVTIGAVTRRMRDRIQSDSVGILLVEGTDELTKFDNQ